MTDFSVGSWRSISERGRAFVGIIPIEGVPLPEPTSHGPDVDSEWHGSVEARRVARSFDETYRGISVFSLGGPLKGELRLGINGERPIWRADHGVEIFRCGVHHAIQCAIVASIDGRLGCSWSGEFTPLFDSVELFIENAAAWATVQGWRYVAVGDISADLALDVLDGLTVDALASGELATWWTSADHVVAVHQYLNPARSGRPQISILAKTPTIKEEARRSLAAVGVDPSVFKAAEVAGGVSARPR